MRDDQYGQNDPNSPIYQDQDERGAVANQGSSGASADPNAVGDPSQAVGMDREWDADQGARHGNQYGSGGYNDPTQSGQQSVFGQQGAMDPGTQQSSTPYSNDPAGQMGSGMDQYSAQQQGSGGQMGGQDTGQYGMGNQMDAREGERDPNIGMGNRGDLEGGYGGNQPDDASGQDM